MTGFNHLRMRNSIRNTEFMARIPEGEEPWNIVDRSNELAGECGEIANICKKIRRHEKGMTNEDIPALINQLKEEIADVMICADLIAMEYDLDTELIIAEKFDKSSIKFNLKTMYFHDSY